MKPGFLDVAGVIKRFGGSTVLHSVNLAVERGEFVSLLGPSGCGKTTLLRIVAGLLASDGGSVRLDGADLTRIPAHKRNVGVVFQNYALFPHLSVAENVAFGLKAQGASRAGIPAVVTEALGRVQMREFADRSVLALSGGQQQRVAVARALAVRPKLLLLDEPFSALDRKLRETMQIELRRLLRQLGITAVFVTHDQDEALIMSDRIAVMNRGEIEQLADPATIYNRPATSFTMEFVGLSSRLAGIVHGGEDGTVLVETAIGKLRGPGNFRPGTKVLVGVRPERLVPEGGPGMNTVSLQLADAVFLGSKWLLHFAAQGEDRLVAEVNPGAVSIPAAGGIMRFGWPVAETLIFPAGGAA